MIRRVIEYSATHKFIVLLGTLFFTAAGIWSLYHINLDAIPDLSDTQVIVFTECPTPSLAGYSFAS